MGDNRIGMNCIHTCTVGRFYQPNWKQYDRNFWVCRKDYMRERWGSLARSSKTRVFTALLLHSSRSYALTSHHDQQKPE